MNNILGAISSSSSDEDDSDDDEFIMHTLLSATHEVVRQRGESLNVEKKRRKSINRDRIMENKLLVCDYFTTDSLYNLSKFKYRFHICINLFLHRR